MAVTSHSKFLTNLYEVFKEYQEKLILPEGIPDVQHYSLLPKLRQYQKRAVKWMVARELNPKFMNQEFIIPSGGILADEMGLGKTVEILSCILVNPRTSFDNKDCKNGPSTFTEAANNDVNFVERKKVETENFLKKKIKRVTINEDCIEIPIKKCKYDDHNLDNISRTIEEVIEMNLPSPLSKNKIHSEDKGVTSKPKRGSGVRKMLQSWYDQELLEMSPSFKKRNFKNLNQGFSELKCCCFQEVKNDKTVMCPTCQTYQHRCCVGYYDVEDGDDYFCFNCWLEKPLVQSGATVIVTPESISNQWLIEIEKHIKQEDLKTLLYNGVRANGYIQPSKLAKYDLIITTYETLRKEIHFADAPSEGRQLRFAKRYLAPTSPLTCVQWWRLCLDEAQMVECNGTNTSEMAQKFTAIHKWAITGTPMQKSVNDLHGLMKFLNITAYSKFNDWTNLVNDHSLFFKFIPLVMWSSRKEDVFEELGIPKQEIIFHWLEFSPVEAFFYQTLHEECFNLFQQKTANCRIQSFEDRVFCYDHRFVKKLMYPLLRIRQACSHHQAVRGQFLNTKDTMTMDELLMNLTDKVKTQCEELLRSLVSVINGIAGLYYVQYEYLNAVESYREVLHLIQEYKDKLKVDSLQKIHVLHNLAEILENHPGIAPPTLRDENLRRDLAELEWKYVNKQEQSMTNCKTNLDKCKEYIGDLCKGRPLGFSEWWLDVLERTIDQDKLLDKILMSLERTDIYHQHQHKSLARKLHNLINVRQELAKWLADLDSARERILVSVQSLCDTPREELASKAAICHISPNQPTKKTKCQLCKFETALAQYGALIFEQKNTAISKKTQDKDESHSIIQKGKSIIDLMNVNLKTLDVIEKGGLKTSQHERVLIELRNQCRAKHMHSETMEEATQHMKLLKYVKREFLHISNFWTLMSQQVCCQDELNMAKIRFQLALPTDEVDDLSPRKKLEMKGKKYTIDAYKVPMELFSSQKTKKEVQQNLKSKLGTLLYLKNLKNEDYDSKTCPICRNNLIDKWTVLTCGHCICLECLPQMLKHSNTSISCVQCRQPCKINDLSYAHNTKTKETNLKGSYSTKIEAVMMEILKLREADPLVKVLIFSSWDKVLDVLGESFIKNDISFRKMSGRKLKASLEDFKTKRVTALLMSLRIGAKGLNLVEATHVFLVEPILDPSEELQAIGRVHRIGQTKNTFVHRFITKNTVEERMMSALEGDSNEPSKWKKENITLKQLYDLFTGYDNNASNSHSHENNPDSPIIDNEVIIE